MKTILKLSIGIFILFLFLTSCHKKDKYEECQDFKMTTKQYAYAISNYKDFNGYATFYRVNYEGENLYLIRLTELNDICLPNDRIYFITNNLEKGKTFFYEEHCDYYIADYDAIIDIYMPVPNDTVNNWVVIREINADTTLITGQFNLKMVRRDENRIKDDPMRPDTLYFWKGWFRAEYEKRE